MKARYDRALADYAKAVSLAPDNAFAITRIAALHAACPDDKVRDGTQAVYFAKKACDLLQWRDLGALETLAAAYAEAADFASAMKWQTEAIALPQIDAEQRRGAEARLQLYRESKPYRESPRK